MIEFQNVAKSYDAGRSYSVKDLSLTVQPGETLALVGSSGSGKSTTLKMVNRLVEPTSGSVLVGGVPVDQQDVLALRRSIGYVIQEVGLFPHMTVEENIGVIPRVLGWPRERRRKRAHELLELVNLDPDTFASRLPRQLSGGQQQRVGVARALAADPAYLLMDEPFGAVDPVTRHDLQQAFLDLKARLGKTILLVTHDIPEAMLLADRIGIMHHGRLEQLGTASELRERPATPFVQRIFSGPPDAVSLEFSEAES